MTRIAYRARWAHRAAALAMGGLLLAGCDVKQELLAPQNPGIIDPSAINSPAAADAVRIGAWGRLKSATGGGETMWLYGGLLTDEWKSSDTFSQRNETDQRAVQTNNANIQGAYTSLQQARGYAQDAIRVLQVYAPTGTANIAQMYFAIGFEEMTLAENFCNGIPLSYTDHGQPNYTDPLTNKDVFTRAAAHFDSALAISTGTDAASVSVHTAALVAKARALLNLAQYTQAAALVPTTAVATSYAYTLTFDQTTGDNGLWSLNNSQGRYTVGDSSDVTGTITNALPFYSAGDPRVPTSSAKKPGFDATTPLYYQLIYGRSDPIALVSGIDARLVEAESKLKGGDLAGMTAILNALRGSAQTIGIIKTPVMAALATPATQDAAARLFLRESAFWQYGRGIRLPTLRRFIRNFGYTANQLFPTGAFHKGGTYGADVNFPVTDNELTNPKFTGCLDRNP